MTNDSTPDFTFTSTETGSTFQCRVDAGTFASCSSPFTTATLTDGSHTFQVRATDAAGNQDATPASRTFTVDTGAPNTTINSGPSGLVSLLPLTYAFTSSESPSTFQCRVDGGAFAGCTPLHTLLSLIDGPHTFDVRAIDGAGNVDPTPASRSFVVDTTPPQTTIDSGPSGLTNDPTPTFTFSSSEPGSTFECRTDSNPFAPCSSPHTTAPLSNGIHSFEVRAIDPAGNTDPSPAIRTTIHVDLNAPDTTIDSGPTGPTSDPTPEFTFSSSETGSTFECRVDSNPFSSCSSPHVTANLSDGPHTFQVRATDPAGNTDPTPASRSFSVDTVVPDTTIDSGPSGLTNDPTPTFGFSSDDNGATFECSVDGGAFTACTTPRTTSSLSDGPHTFEVRARDTAGNVDPTPASRSIVVDTNTPETTIDSGPAGTIGDPTPTFTFSSDETPSTFECSIDGGPFVPCSSPYTTPSLADGPHTLEVQATDQAGNVDPTPASRTFTVDTDAPETTIDRGPDRHHRRPDARVHLQLRRAGLDLRVPHRRWQLGSAAPRPSRRRTCPTARTPSRSARPTRPATPTARRSPAPSRSTPPRRTWS